MGLGNGIKQTGDAALTGMDVDVFINVQRQ